MKRIFVDTSGWYALLDGDDPNHSAATAWFKENKYPLITCNHVFSETLTLVKYRLGHEQAETFGGKLRVSRSVLLYRVEAEEEEAAWALFTKYSDKQFSFVDCISFAVMHSLKVKDALAFDKHFRQAGFNMVP
ncbi:MAG: type II toxin-antitoxin system VapC family toxin [Nitrospirae bacterium]|nr:type II toxin-antitoxin system VapC family toxin [Nitrospirota bacterium]